MPIFLKLFIFFNSDVPITPGSDAVCLSDKVTYSRAWNNDVWKFWTCGTPLKGTVIVALTMMPSEMMEMTNLAIRTTNERILKEELGTDVTTVAGNGVRIKCHMSFIKVRSEVLAAELEAAAATSAFQMAGMRV